MSFAIRPAFARRPVVIPCLAVAVSSCAGDLSFLDADGRSFEPPSGTAAHERQARELWATMESHDTWSHPALRPGWQPATAPHGQWLKTYLNPAAAASTSTFAEGSVIMAKSYADQDEDTLEFITAMTRVPGFEPEHGDWFWAKFAPDGSLMLDAQGASLAGAIGKGAQVGCIDCHTGASGSDYVFANGPATGSGSGSMDDLARAARLWADMVNHESWPSFADRPGWRPGEAPHGPWLTLHLDSTALADTAELRDGAILVARNYSAKEMSSLTSITAMQKIEGFNPAGGGWFWAQFTPGGQVASAADGTMMAGAVGGDSPAACMTCHGSAPGDDWIFGN